jgi:hypothetical protein
MVFAQPSSKVRRFFERAHGLHRSNSTALLLAGGGGGFWVSQFASLAYLLYLFGSMKPVHSDIQFPKLEEAILEFWKQNQIVEQGLEANRGKEPFVFYDGPPFATGLPHYGHILPGTLKDIVPRYWVMKGRYVQRRWNLSSKKSSGCRA